MRAALLLVLLGGLRLDVEDGRKALSAALTDATKHEPIAGNIKYLVGIDDERVPDALADCYLKGLDLLRAAQKDLQKHAKEMEDTKPVYDQYGRYVRGRADLYIKAEEAYKVALQRSGMLDYWLPKICEAFLDLRTDAHVKGLLRQLKTGDWFLRAHAALGLGKSESREACEALLAAAKAEKDATLRVALIDALARRTKDDPAVRDLVIEGVKASDWQVQIAALQALRTSPAKEAAVHLITALKGSTGRVRWEINETLKAITGVDKHAEPDAWKAWWDEHGEEFLAGAYKPHPSELADAKGFSTFYGIPIHSTRLVLLIDTSGSMQEEPKWLPPDFTAPARTKPTRLEVAKFELKRCVNALPAACDYNVVCFHSWLEPFAEKMQKMDNASRSKCAKWVEAIKMGDGTRTWEALEECYRQAGGGFWAKNKADSLDTIFLMTDGVPSSGVTDHRQFVQKVAVMARFKKIAIVTIGVDPEPNGEELLKGIAAATGGQYYRR